MKFPPLEVVNPRGDSAFLLVCDHASNRIPGYLHDLGLDPETLNTHIAWDPGAAMVARRLAERLDAPLVLANYSRLVIDCNRPAESPESILEISHGTEIPGNRNLTAGQRAERKKSLFDPYHQAIHGLLEERKGMTRAMVSIHSFTPVLQGRGRPWSIGVCYDDDRRLVEILLAALPGRVQGEVGDNQPYAIEKGVDFTLPHHAGGRGLPHVMLELRQDTVKTDSQAVWWAGLLADVLGAGHKL